MDVSLDPKLQCLLKVKQTINKIKLSLNYIESGVLFLDK